MRRTYEIDFTDPETGATSPIDTQYVDGEYTAEQYIADCENNADEDWCEMLHSGTVEVVEVGIFDIESAESGDKIEGWLTYKEALDTIKRYEADDIAEGTYEKGFYAIRNTETDECEVITNTYPHENPEARREALAAELDEMVALGWTDEEAKEDEDGFFERIGKFADGISREEVWEIWKNVWEYKMEEAEKVSNNYWWIDLYSTEFFTLYKGRLDDDGAKDRDTEEEVLSCRYDDIDVNPLTDDDETRTKNWKKIDAYITEQLGFLPDYEVN